MFTQNSPLMKTLLSLTLAACSYLLQAQITLKPYDEPGKSGTKSIVFEYTPEGVTAAPGQPVKKVKKEFDIQASNPYNNISLNESRGNSDGSKVFRIEAEESKEIHNRLGLKYDSELASSKVSLEAKSHIKFTVKENYAAVVYNLFLYDSYGYVSENGRIATVKIIDKSGEVVQTLDNLPLDIYSMELSSDGRFFFYAYGEPIEHAEDFPQSGFRIIDLNDQSIFYEKEVYRIKGFFQNPDEININSVEKEGNLLYSFDEISHHLFKLDKATIGPHIGHQLYIGINGDTLNVSNIDFIK